MANSKQRYSDLKPNFALIPGSAMVAMAPALEIGAKKYGPFNWRVSEIETMTYIAATMRHLMAWVDGEELASDTGINHLGHALASLAILVDAISIGMIFDTRPVKGNTASLIAQVEACRRAQPTDRAIANSPPFACPDLDQSYGLDEPNPEDFWCQPVPKADKEPI